MLEDGGSEDEAIAALLHDAVEDADGKERLRAIHARFGERVAAMVAGCSDTDESPKPPWRERKERYVRHLKTEADASTLRVSLADKLHNARAVLRDHRAIGEAIWEPRPMVDELAEVVGEIRARHEQGTRAARV